MKLLLDTHTFLWHADGNSRMSATATELLVDPSNDLFLSMATVWEVAIKTGLGKLTLAKPYVAYMTRAIEGYGLTVLPITFEDCAEYAALAFPKPKHRDPFDRLIVAHAGRNGLHVVGSDANFDAYGVHRHW